MAEERTGGISGQQAGADAGAAPAQPDLGQPSQPVTADALLQLIQQTYRPLDSAEQERVRTAIGAMQQAAAAMYAYPLTNADEPAPIFMAYRSD